jgi:hypothetical protein
MVTGVMAQEGALESARHPPRVMGLRCAGKSFCSLSL